MSRDALIVSFLVAVALAAAVFFFFVLNEEQEDPGFVPADPQGQVDNDVRRAASRPTGPATVVNQGASGGATPAGSSVKVEDSTVPESERGGLEGRVFDPEGRPVAGCTAALCVDVSDSLHMSLQGPVKAFATTDGQGRFSIAEISTEDRYILRVDDERYPSKIVPLVSLEPGKKKTLEVRLENGAVLVGVVTDVEGMRLSECEIMVYDQQHRSQDPEFDVERRMLTDVNGEYRFQNLNPGYKRVTARKVGFASETNLTVQIGRDKQNDPVNFSLSPGSVIAGIVVDKVSGEPLSEILVSANPIRNGTRNIVSANYPPVKTDETGRFDYSGLATGAYKLRFHGKGFGRVGVQQTARTGEEDLRIELERMPVARGRVVDELTGEPITRFSLQLGRGEQLMMSSYQLTQRFNDDRGEFEYVDLETN
ncbi:MAG: carboxypeptidase regulatory-like domain-containing protein, partial [Planctomycetes bacterium]|nr:carboxypeptidase regulatory-like domain-containing protein [Planctomycetota bacterium]